MNVECDKQALDELTSAFRFNDAVIRNLVIQRREAITEPSPLARARDERDTFPAVNEPDEGQLHEGDSNDGDEDVLGK